MPFVIIGVVVALIALITVIKATQTAKQNQDKQDAEKAMKVLDEKDDFQKFLGYNSSSKPTPSATRPTAGQLRAKEEKVQQLAKHFEEQGSNGNIPPSKQMQINRTLNALQAKIDAQKSQSQTVSGGHHQSHCDISEHGESEKYRVEYVPTMNSIGGSSTEGCQDHYNTRYVKIDEKIEKNVELTQLQRIMVFGEVLNNPKFKRR